MRKIHEYRSSVGMSQKQFAEYLGMSKRTLENWELYEKGSKSQIIRKPPGYIYRMLELIFGSAERL